MENECRDKKILDPNIEVTAHCVGPVFIGHSESVFVECENNVDENEARNLLKNQRNYRY